MIAFETDYPHSDCLWPDAPEDLLAQCVGAGCSDEDIDQISWKNVARFCNYDPFKDIPRHEATVGALRAQSPDVDTGVWSRGRSGGLATRRTPVRRRHGLNIRASAVLEPEPGQEPVLRKSSRLSRMMRRCSSSVNAPSWEFT